MIPIFVCSSSESTITEDFDDFMDSIEAILRFEEEFDLSSSDGKVNPVTPRKVTKEDIENNIIQEFSFTLNDALKGAATAEIAERYGHESLGLTTMYALVLKNGYTVVGKSACVDPQNFCESTGTQLAREDAIKQIWPLMGYALKERMDRETND